MIGKAHIANEKKIVSICDDSLLGKKFEQGDLQIDLTSSFYRGEEASEEKLRELLKGAYLADFVGEESVKFAIKEKLASEKGVIRVAGVPHAQVFSIE